MTRCHQGCRRRVPRCHREGSAFRCRPKQRSGTSSRGRPLWVEERRPFSHLGVLLVAINRDRDESRGRSDGDVDREHGDI